MAAIKYVDLTRLTQYDGLIKNYINTADAKSYKFAKFDVATSTFSLYKVENPDTDTVADFSFEIPETDVSNLLEKISNGTAGNVVVVGADGTVADGGVALTNLATKASVDSIDGKIGTITDLETTAKTDLVSAINEVKDAVSSSETSSTITVDTSTTTEGMLKSYTIKQGSSTVATIDIPKDLVVTEGSVVVDPEGEPEGTYIKLVIANQSEPLYINVGTLVDLYTAQTDATQIQLSISSSTREISATIVAGSVTDTELASNAVTTAKIADANVTLAKLAEDAKNAFDASGSALAAETNAKTYADGLNSAMDARVDTIETAIGDGGSIDLAIKDAKQAGTNAAAAVTSLEEGAVASNTSKITALEAKVGDGFVAVTEEEVQALFAS